MNGWIMKDFQNGLQKRNSRQTQEISSICEKDIDLSSMGVGTLIRPSLGKKYKEK